MKLQFNLTSCLRQRFDWPFYVSHAHPVPAPHKLKGHRPAKDETFRM